MTRAPLLIVLASASTLVVGACASSPVPPPAVGAPVAGYAPKTAVTHDLAARQRIEDHVSRLGDGIARYREVKGERLPQTLRELALTMAADGRPCFTEGVKDLWVQPDA